MTAAALFFDAGGCGQMLFTVHEIPKHMIVISRFGGIVIVMFAEADERHNLPHLYFRYGEHHATFIVSTDDILAGSFPKPQVQAGIELHREQLEEDW